MQSPNAIQQRLEDRCKKEIKEIVSKFISDIERLEKQNKVLSNSYSFNTHFNLTDITADTLRYRLEGILIQEHLSQMVKLKSEDLLKKLDLLD